jgi:uncharacterized membrane protein
VTNSSRDHDTGTERAVSLILRIGVGASLLLIAAGSLLSFLEPGGYGRSSSEAARLSGTGGAFPRTWDWLSQGVRHGNGQAVIVVGLLLLIATPVLRVAISVVAFVREGDRVYACITGLVLLLLLLSFELGKAG